MYLLLLLRKSFSYMSPLITLVRLTKAQVCGCSSRFCRVRSSQGRLMRLVVEERCKV